MFGADAVRVVVPHSSACTSLRGAAMLLAQLKPKSLDRNAIASGEMSITISSAELADADAIAALLKECWAATYSSFLSTRTLQDVAQQWHHPDILRRQIANPKVAFLIARTDSGILVGAGNAKLVADGAALDVQRLYVHAAYQRQGIGSHLLRTMLAVFAKADTVQLEVAELNSLGRAFWIKSGFREGGRSRIEVGNGVLDLVKMSKRVAA